MRHCPKFNSNWILELYGFDFMDITVVLYFFFILNTSEHYVISGLNTGCFSHRWPILGARKSAPKKWKNNFFFQDKGSATWRAAKLGIFTHFTLTNLPRCNPSINSLIYVYSIQIPSCFLWRLDHSHDRTSP